MALTSQTSKDAILPILYLRIERARSPSVIFGVGPTWSKTKVRESYHKIALQIHPDKIPDDSLRKRHTWLFQTVQGAYENLLSRDSRAHEADDKEQERLREKKVKEINTVSKARGSDRVLTTAERAAGEAKICRYCADAIDTNATPKTILTKYEKPTPKYKPFRYVGDAFYPASGKDKDFGDCLRTIIEDVALRWDKQLLSGGRCSGGTVSLAQKLARENSAAARELRGIMAANKWLYDRLPKVTGRELLFQDVIMDVTGEAFQGAAVQARADINCALRCLDADVVEQYFLANADLLEK